MFEIGKYYRVWMIQNGVEGEFDAGVVTEVDMPLVKFKASALVGGKETIVNTASSAFIKGAGKSKLGHYPKFDFPDELG